MKGRVIQIMPAPDNLFAVYGKNGGEEERKALCVALTDQGSVFPMVMNNDGSVRETGEEDTFKRFEWK